MMNYKLLLIPLVFVLGFWTAGKFTSATESSDEPCIVELSEADLAWMSSNDFPLSKPLSGWVVSRSGRIPLSVTANKVGDSDKVYLHGEYTKTGVRVTGFLTTDPDATGIRASGVTPRSPACPFVFVALDRNIESLWFQPTGRTETDLSDLFGPL